MLLGGSGTAATLHWLEPQPQQETPNLSQAAVQAGPLFDGLLGLSKGAWRMLTEVLFQADPVVVELTTASFPGEAADSIEAALGELFEIAGNGSPGNAGQAGDLVMGQALAV